MSSPAATPPAPGAGETPALRQAGLGLPPAPVSSARQDDSDGQYLTMPGQAMGTPQYMAPEQACGKIDELDARTDVYALGAVLYHLLTLHPPIAADTAPAVMVKAVRGEITPPSVYSLASAQAARRAKATRAAGRRAAATTPLAATPTAEGEPAKPPVILRHCPDCQVPDALAAVALRALARDPAARYADVPALQREVEAYLHGFATSAEQAGLWRQLHLLVRRHRAVSATAAAAVLVLLLVVAGFLVRVNAEKNRALASEHRALAAQEEAETNLGLFQQEQAARQALSRQAAPEYLARGRAQMGRYEWQAAAQSFDIALALDPALAEAWFNRGRLHLVMREPLLARSALQRSGEFSPVAPAVLRLAEVYAPRLLNGQWGPRDLAELETAASAVDVELAVGLRLFSGDTAGNLTSRLEAARLAILRANGIDERDRGFVWTVRLTQTSASLSAAHPRMTDLSPLAGIPLSQLALRGAITDLSPLVGMPLDYLQVGGNPLSDLRPLRGMPLTSLRINSTRVTDLSLLSGLPLEQLFLGGVKVDDLTPLRGMKLRLLYLNDSPTPVADLEALRGMPLETLNLAANGRLRNLAPLQGMRLTWLDLNSCRQVRDFSPLAGMPISYLNLSHCEQLGDLSPLAGMPLSVLKLNGCPRLRGLAPLQGMPLKSLVLENCSGLTDLEPLAHCTLLEELTLPSQVKDIECLRSLPALRLLSYRWVANSPALAAAEFWRRHDEAKAKGLPWPPKDMLAPATAPEEAPGESAEPELPQLTPRGDHK